MKKNHKFLSTLGLCRKAGKLQWGFDVTSGLIASGAAKLIVLTRDLSPKSAKEITRLAQRQNIDILYAPAAMDEIERLAGKRAGILAITDEGLSNSIRAAAEACQEEESTC